MEPLLAREVRGKAEAAGQAPAAAEVAVAFRFDSSQRTVHEALARQDSRLADMYFGAIFALAHPENPEARVHATHSLRELMEKLPRYNHALSMRDHGETPFMSSARRTAGP